MQYKVAIIQLTRIGDILQTAIATETLKRENPDAHYTLICREKFGKNIEFILKKTFDDIIYINTKNLFSNEHDHLSGIREKLKNVIQKCNSKKFDFLFNLSFNKSSSYFTKLIHAKQKFGIQRSNSDQLVIKDQVSQFIYSSVLGSSLTPFNLVDLFRSVMGVKTLPYLPVTSNIKRKSILIHPFASHNRKRLSISKWGEIIYQTLKKNPHFEVVIVGSPEDIDDNKRLLSLPIVKAYSERIKSLVGKASIEVVYNNLKDCALFIGHDSMVSHLTSFHQTPSLVISLGTVRPMETTPYNENAYILSSKVKCFPCNLSTSCDVLSCHSDIHASMVSQIASSIILNEAIDENYIKKNLNIFQVNQCRISKAFAIKDIGILLASLTDDYQSVSDVFRVYYGIIWSYFFKEIDYPASLPKVTVQTANELSHYLKGVEQLFELYGYGAAFSKRIVEDAKAKNIDISSIQDSVKKISSLDQLLMILKQQFNELSPLIDFINTMKLNSDGENIIEIAEGNLLSFHDGKNLLTIIQELIEKTIETAVPKHSKAPMREV